MASPQWSFQLTDRRFVPVGEILNAKDRKVANPLNKLDTCSFKVLLENPLADALLTCEGYIKAYRNEVLRYFGPIISAEERVDASNGTVSVNSVGAGWVLTKRLLGKSAQGTAVATWKTKENQARTLINLANADGETHIESGYNEPGSHIEMLVSEPYTAGPYKWALDCLNELATGSTTGTAGFDWRLMPYENFEPGDDSPSSKIASLDLEDHMGQFRPDAVFESGTGRNNVQGYSRIVSRDGQMNKGYHLPPSGAASGSVRSVLDPSSISDWGLLEDLVQADLIDTARRDNLVNLHVAIRHEPRQIINMTPMVTGTIGVPEPGVDYDVGDSITFRAKYADRIRFNAAMRAWGLTFEIQDNGMEKVTVALEKES